MRFLVPMACALLVLAACGDGDSPFIETPTPTVADVSQTPGPARTATSAPGSCTEQQYEVQAGDVLGAIAVEFGVTVEAIAEASNLTDPDSLTIGQQLTIPCPTETDAPTEAPTETAAAGA